MDRPTAVANDIRYYNYIKDKAEKLGITIDLTGEAFSMKRGKENLGRVGELSGLANYILGFEAGHSLGISDEIKRHNKPEKPEKPNKPKKTKKSNDESQTHK